MDEISQEHSEVTVDDLEILYRQNYNCFVSFAKNLSRDIDIAEDLVQDVYLKLIKNKHLLKEGNLKSYVFQSIRNNFITLTTRLTYERSSIPLSHFSDESLEEIAELKMDPNLDWINKEETSERKVILREAMDEMTPFQREAFQYRIIKGLSTREIASITGKKESSIRMNNHRAYNTLRGTLARHGIEWNSRVPYIFDKKPGKKNVA